MPIDLGANPDHPYTLTTFQGEDGIVTVDLGTDPQTGISYSLFATLQPMPMGIPALMEFIFWIAEYEPATGHIYKVWDGKLTKKVFAGRDRAFILHLVCEALSYLVGMFNPSTIFYQTCEPDLPEKALVKYYVIGRRLMEHHYKVWAQDTYHGHNSWIAELLATA